MAMTSPQTLVSALAVMNMSGSIASISVPECVIARTGFVRSVASLAFRFG
jgi:hypothetical protein